MLNRRTLRIKIMQTLFAYEQCKEADYGLALELINNTFQPDLNSMKIQDKGLLKGQRDVAVTFFEKKFNGQETPEIVDPAIEKAIEDALALYSTHQEKDFIFFQKQLPDEIEKINRHYLSILNLLPALATADRKPASANFAENVFIRALRQSSELKRESKSAESNWDSRMDLVRGWYRDCVKPDQEFVAYIELKQPSFDDQKTFIRHLLRRIVLGETAINAYFEEQDLHWAEDQDIVKSLVEKSLKTVTTEGTGVELQKLSLDWEDDLLFMKKLFGKAAKLEVQYQEMIAQNTRNWEVERLPLTDRVILQMAIAELIEFPGIPVKVTINEYIELAKQYSTPKSRQFVNGILDVMARELKEKGHLRKSGRGLVDNK